MVKVGVLLVGFLVACPAESADSPATEAKDKEKASLRDQLSESMSSQNWEKAAAALRKLQALSTASEKSNLEGISTRLSGEKEWDKIEKEYPSSQPRRVITKIDAFLKKYGEEPDFKTRAEELRKKAIAEVYHTIEDFEKDRKDLDIDLVRIQEPGKVKQGTFAARWVSKKKDSDAVYFPAGPAQDWTKFSALVLWIYSEKPNGRLTIDAVSGEDDYFEAWNNIDWTGWKEVRLPLRGKESRFHKDGKPDWANVGDLRVWKDKVVSVEIIIDDIRLERGP